MGVGQEAVTSFLGCQLFSSSWKFCGSSASSTKSQVPQSVLRDWLQTSHQAVRETVLCTACFVYSIVISIINIIISFVVLLNCLYLNLQVLPFVTFCPFLLSISLWKKGRGEQQLSDV